jgi:hypothetical protein
MTLPRTFQRGAGVSSLHTGYKIKEYSAFGAPIDLVADGPFPTAGETPKRQSGEFRQKCLERFV